MCRDGRNSADAARVGAVRGGLFYVRLPRAATVGRRGLAAARLDCRVARGGTPAARGACPHQEDCRAAISGQAGAQRIKLRGMIHNSIDKGNEFINTGFILPCVFKILP